MKIRLPGFYYILRCKFRSFAARNWRGCEYCNEKVLFKLLGGDVGSLEKPLGSQFNTLLDSVPINGNTRNNACYFYPMRGCIEVTEVDKGMRMATPLEHIFVNNCPECGRALHKIRFKKKDKGKDNA